MLRSVLPTVDMEQLLKHEQWYRGSQAIATRKKNILAKFAEDKESLVCNGRKQLQQLAEETEKARKRESDMIAFEERRRETARRLQSLRVAKEHELTTSLAEMNRMQMEAQLKEEELALLEAERVSEMKRKVQEFRRLREEEREQRRREEEQKEREEAEKKKAQLELTRADVERREDLRKEKERERKRKEVSQ